MKNKLILIIYLIAHALIFPQSSNEGKIVWDEYQVPHIIVSDESQLYYLFGQAQMELHCNLLLEQFGKVRGRASEYWGKEHLNNDILVRKLGIPKRSVEWLSKQNSEMLLRLNQFVKGINKYAEENPEKIAIRFQKVLPVKTEDIFSLLQYSYHYKVAAFALQSKMKGWKNAGSNAWAIAPLKSESGNSMLLIQPHPPWMDEYRFLEVHLKTNEFNLYGITQVGSPIIAMGFNENLGWGLTFNQADSHDLYEIVTSDEGYYVDGKLHQFDVRTEYISYVEDGNLKRDTFTVKSTIFGNVIEEKPDKVLAIRISGLDRPYMTEQFYNMGKAKNRGEFEKAVSKLQMPLQNIIYADKHGEIAYIYNGIIPKRSIDNYGLWTTVQDGNKSTLLVGEYLRYEELPKFANPQSGFVANTNNPPHSSTFPEELSENEIPSYIAPKFIDERTVRSLKMLVDKNKVSFSDLEKMQNDTRSQLADRYLPQLIEYAEKSKKSEVNKAGRILTDWDRRVTPESIGSVIFAQWYFAARKHIPQLNTDTKIALNDAPLLSEEARRSFDIAVDVIIKKYGNLEVKWGEVYKVFLNGRYFPSSVGINELGNFKAGFYRPDRDNKFVLVGGPAFSMIVEFGDKVKAKSLLPYGNSTRKRDHKQLYMLNEGEMKDIKFYFDK